MSGDFEKDYPDVAVRLRVLERSVAALMREAAAAARAARERSDARRKALEEIGEAMRQFDEGNMRRVSPRAISERSEGP